MYHSKGHIRLVEDTSWQGEGRDHWPRLVSLSGASFAILVKDLLKKMYLLSSIDPYHGAGQAHGVCSRTIELNGAGGLTATVL